MHGEYMHDFAINHILKVFNSGKYKWKCVLITENCRAKIAGVCDWCDGTAAFVTA